MADNFSSATPSLESPLSRLSPVTPSDSVDLNPATRAINVAGSGNVRVTTTDGDTATIFVAAGIAFPVRVSRVWNSGTTATGIVAMS